MASSTLAAAWRKQARKIIARTGMAAWRSCAIWREISERASRRKRQAASVASENRHQRQRRRKKISISIGVVAAAKQRHRRRRQRNIGSIMAAHIGSMAK